MRAGYSILGAALSISLLMAAQSSAQEQQTQQQQTQPQQQQPPQDQSSTPIPAYRSPLAGAADQGAVDESPEQMSPDTRSLSGAQDLSTGSPAQRRSYWQPHLGFSATADSNGLTSSGSGWTTWGSVYGGLDVHDFSGHSNLTFTYLGGGLFSDDQSTSNGTVQGLTFDDRLTYRRETLSLLDQLSYLPAASLGLGPAGGLGDIGLPGVSSLGLTSNFVPGQTILTTTGSDLLESAVLESDTAFSRRSSFSLVGGYSTQRYFDNNLLNYYNLNFKGGYNYQISSKDTIALSYLFSGFRYVNFDQSINSHIVQISYGRRVTGRLGFQVAAGPDVSYFTFPITQGVAQPGSPLGNTRQLYLSVNTSLQYQLERTSLSASYFHGVSGGAGVLAGAITDSVSGNANHQLTRTLGSGFNFGYSRNSGVSFSSQVPTTQSYDYWFGGASLNRVLGRELNLLLSYQFQYQTSNTNFCVATSCSTNFTRHLVSVGFDWHARPRPF